MSALPDEPLAAGPAWRLLRITIQTLVHAASQRVGEDELLLRKNDVYRAAHEYARAYARTLGGSADAPHPHTAERVASRAQPHPQPEREGSRR